MTKKKLFDITEHTKRANTAHFFLGDDQPLNIQSILSGYSWSGKANTQATIFHTFDPAFYINNLPTYNVQNPITLATNIATLNTTAPAIRAMLGWTNVANIAFVESSNANMASLQANVINTQGQTIGGVTYSLSSYNDFLKRAQITNAMVFLNEHYTQTDLFYRINTNLHEFGHGIGLKHPFGLSQDSRPENSILSDNWDVSIMSYTPGLHTTHTSSSLSTFSRTPTTPSVYDIQAAQYLYGPNTAYMAGDTTYTIQPSGNIQIIDSLVNGLDFNLEGPVVTLWDAGGTDTIDTTLITDPVVVDLREGIDPTTVSAKPSPYATKAKDTVVFLAMPAHIENAQGANIENARTGSGNDVLYGNHLPNRLEGGLGDDSYYDSLENDEYVDIGGSNSYFFEHTTFGNDTITDPGTFRVFIDGFEFKGYAIQPRGEMVTRYAATHKNGQVYEIEHVGIDLTIRPSGETRYIKLTNFRPHQLSVGLGEQTMQSFISIPSDDVPWDGYVNQLNCLEKGPVYVTAPSGTANGRIVGSPQNDILSVGTGGRATSAFDKIELWGCGGKDRLYANDNNKSLSAVA